MGTDSHPPPMVTGNTTVVPMCYVVCIRYIVQYIIKYTDIQRNRLARASTSTSTST